MCKTSCRSFLIYLQVKPINTFFFGKNPIFCTRYDTLYLNQNTKRKKCYQAIYQFIHIFNKFMCDTIKNSNILNLFGKLK